MTTRPYSVADRPAGPEENTFDRSVADTRHRHLAKKILVEAYVENIVVRESKGCVQIYTVY